MKRSHRRRRLDERGVSLVETTVGIVVLMTALVGLLGATGLAARATVQGRRDLLWWSAVQWKGDSLLALGAGNVADGSDVVNGYPVSWAVSGGDPERLDLVIERKMSAGDGTVQDTLVLYLRD